MIKQDRLQAQHGVALALMMWMIAAMSLMVAGAVLLGKQEIKAAHSQLQQAQMKALGNGLIHLAMQTWNTSVEPRNNIQRRGSSASQSASAMPVLSFSYHEQEVSVRAVPVNALISLRGASEALLTIALAAAVPMPESDAGALAAQWVLWRSGGLEDADQQGLQPRGFRVFEDLLQVPGMNRDIMERLRPIATVYGSHEGINLMAAPRELLTVLAGGNDALVEQLMLAQAENPESVADALGGLAGQFQTSASSNIQRIDVRVRFADQQVWQYSRYVAAGIGKQGFPWILLRDQAPHQVSALAF